MKLYSTIAVLCCGVVLPTVLSGASAAPTAEATPGLTLEDLWEYTPTTKDLIHVWRVYRRQRLASKLHEQLRLYFVCPKAWQRSDSRPAIVFVHGGGWSNGTADQWFPQCRYFALRGMVAVSVQYRLRSKRADVNGCLADCKSAIRYLRGHAKELGVDPQRIAVLGESAGGHLVAALGTIDGFDHPEDDLFISALPDALILLNPITDLTTKWSRSFGDKAMALSPLHHVSRKTPPTLLLHGDRDNGVDISKHSRAFRDKMKTLGRPSKLVVLEGAGHAFGVFQYGPDRYVKRAILEIDEYLTDRGWLSGVPLRFKDDRPIESTAREGKRNDGALASAGG